jgi:2'-5' RNA ligase
LRCSLGAALAEKRMTRLARREFTPHVTLLYAEREVEENPIEAIRWTVNDFVLVQSLRGHRFLARWPLQPCLQRLQLI